MNAPYETMLQSLPNKPLDLSPPAASVKIPYVVTVATQHSGSTLLAMLLDNHSAIASVGECSRSPSSLRRGKDPASYRCSCGQTLLDCSMWKRIFADVQGAGMPLSESRWVNDLRYRHAMAHRLLTVYRPFAPWSQLQRAADRWLPLHRGRVQAANHASLVLARSVLAVTGKSIFFDSCKSLKKHSLLLQNPALDVRVVRLMRDVRAFVLSRSRRGLSAKSAARQWLDYHRCADELLKQLPAERIQTITYEELCDEPSATVKRIHRFLGVAEESPPTELHPRNHHVLGNKLRENDSIRLRSVGWQDRLAPADAATAMRIAGDYNRRCGYPDEVLSSCSP